jgi:hypothetical protein
MSTVEDAGGVVSILELEHRTEGVGVAQSQSRSQPRLPLRPSSCPPLNPRSQTPQTPGPRPQTPQTDTPPALVPLYRPYGARVAGDPLAQYYARDH